MYLRWKEQKRLDSMYARAHCTLHKEVENCTQHKLNLIWSNQPAHFFKLTHYNLKCMPVSLIFYILSCTINGHFAFCIYEFDFWWDKPFLCRNIFFLSILVYVPLLLMLLLLLLKCIECAGCIIIKIYLYLWSIDKNRSVRRQIMHSFLHVWTFK